MLKKSTKITKIEKIEENNYLKIAKISNKSKYIVENIIIKDILSIEDSNSRIIKY